MVMMLSSHKTRSESWAIINGLSRRKRMVALREIRAAAERIRGVVHHTPLDRSDNFSRVTGARLFLKLESLQRAGSFKIRGAYNCIAQLTPEQRARGVAAAPAAHHAHA